MASPSFCKCSLDGVGNKRSNKKISGRGCFAWVYVALVRSIGLFVFQWATGIRVSPFLLVLSDWK